MFGGYTFRSTRAPGLPTPVSSAVPAASIAGIRAVYAATASTSGGLAASPTPGGPTSSPQPAASAWTPPCTTTPAAAPTAPLAPSRAAAGRALAASALLRSCRARALIGPAQASPAPSTGGSAAASSPGGGGGHAGGRPGRVTHPFTPTCPDCHAVTATSAAAPTRGRSTGGPPQET